MIEIVHDRRDADGGVDLRESASSGLRLGDGVCHVPFIEQHLSLQIGDLDEVAVDDCQVTDAGSGEELRGHAAKRATPKDERGRIAQTPLPIFAEAGKPAPGDGNGKGGHSCLEKSGGAPGFLSNAFTGNRRVTGAGDPVEPFRSVVRAVERQHRIAGNPSATTCRTRPVP